MNDTCQMTLFAVIFCNIFYVIILLCYKFTVVVLPHDVCQQILRIMHDFLFFLVKKQTIKEKTPVLAEVSSGVSDTW